MKMGSFIKEMNGKHEKSIEIHCPKKVDRSAWENGLDCINSLLMPGSAVLAAMTDEQRQGLEDLKTMMLSSPGDGEETAKHYVPQALLDASENASSDFLLAEYGGYNRRLIARTTLHGVLSAQKIAIKLKRMAGDSLQRSQILLLAGENSAIDNIPAHWFSLDNESKLKLRNALSWKSISRWDFDIFEVDQVLKGKNTLVFVAWAIIASPQSQYAMDVACSQLSDEPNTRIEEISDREGYFFLSDLQVREKTLVKFLHAIEEKYNDVIYHNQLHAADVTQGLHALLQMGGEKYASGKLEAFSILIAAVIHDVGHKGLTNSFLINLRSESALIYNDVSVAENMHLSTSFRLIMGDGRNRHVDIFENFLEEEIEEARRLIIKAVLSTDMTKHFTKMNIMKGIKMKNEEGTVQNGHHCGIPDDVCLKCEMLSFLLHLADISNQTRQTPIATKWTDRILNEFWRQGDMEERMGLPFSPLTDRNTTDRAKSQIGFINFIVLPAFELIGEFIPQIRTELVPKIDQNLKFWESQARLNLTSGTE